MYHFLSHLILIAEDQLLRPTTITLNTLLQATEDEEVLLQLQKYGTPWKKHVFFAYFCGSFRLERRNILQNIDVSYTDMVFAGKSLLHAKKEATISNIPELKFLVCLDSC